MTDDPFLGDVDDQEQYSVGLNVGFSGFTVGGSYAHENDDIIEDGDAWDVVATYATGPWTVGGVYFSSDVEYGDAVGFASGGAIPGDEAELDAVQGGVGYAVGPGISASASILYADYDTDGGDADGVVGVIGITYTY